jgi:hypothetical protein
VDYAGGRPFAWVDDEQSELDQTYVIAHHQGPGSSVTSTRGSAYGRTTSAHSPTTPGP